MKLTYRGNSYEVSALNQLEFDSAEQPKIQLVYRGHTYEYTPYHVIVSEEDKTDFPSVTVIYRGVKYEQKVQSPAQVRPKVLLY
ncbi:MAG: DUF4278 domain-containing protein [Cyanobacteria bacterium P01_A01_bin.17]